MPQRRCLRFRTNADMSGQKRRTRNSELPTSKFGVGRWAFKVSVGLRESPALEKNRPRHLSELKKRGRGFSPRLGLGHGGAAAPLGHVRLKQSCGRMAGNEEEINTKCRNCQSRFAERKGWKSCFGPSLYGCIDGNTSGISTTSMGGHPVTGRDIETHPCPVSAKGPPLGPPRISIRTLRPRYAKPCPAPRRPPRSSA